MVLAIVVVLVLRRKETVESLGFTWAGGYQDGVATRGKRNNNPLNIRDVPGNNWKGRIGSDGAFVRFDTMENGFRAAVKILVDDVLNDGNETVSEIVNAWAPVGDGNNVDAYLGYISDSVGLAGDVVVDSVSRMSKLLKAMAYVESRVVISQDVGANLVVRYGGSNFA